MSIEASDNIREGLLRTMMTKCNRTFKVVQDSSHRAPSKIAKSKKRSAAETSSSSGSNETTKKTKKSKRESESAAPSKAGDSGDDLGALQKKNKSLLRKIKILRKKSKRRKSKLKAVREENSQMRRENSQMRTENFQMRSSLMALQQRPTSEGATSSSSMPGLTSSIECMSRRIDELQEQLENK